MVSKTFGSQIRRHVSFEQVKITDNFWSPRIAANRDRGLYAVHHQLRTTGRLKVYDLDWRPGTNKPAPHVFWDSDVAKWLEGASYSLITHPDKALQRKVEDVVDRILSAQGEDGYINPHFTVVAPDGRWSNLRDHHELYCAGHLIEAAIAHHRATGDPRFLEGVRRYADLIDRTFGWGKEQRRGYPGHEEIELALVKLFRYTGEKRYLELASFFIEERGTQPHYFDLEAQARGERPADYWAGRHAYTQSHLPVREQTEVVGHAVRAMYLYCAMADLAGELGDESLFQTLQVLWKDLVSHKMFLTGGIGSSRTNEGFTRPYDLPNQDAYAETCAAIGLIFWAHRMLAIDLDSQYADVLERVLYNGMLSGVSLRGDEFFYVNPLASDGSHHRQRFFTCSCCPPNINRILPVIGEYIYSVGMNDIAVHLYIQNETTINLNDEPITLIQETDYPWDGVVCIRCKVKNPIYFSLRLRKPGWCKEARMYLNAEPVEIQSRLDQGYITLSREWQTGDEIQLHWLMPVARIYAHPDVRADINRTALMRGPLVFCLEAMDHSVPLHHLRLPRKAPLESTFEPDLLEGVVTICAQACAVDCRCWEDALYKTSLPALMQVPIKGIPFYAWDNRQAGAMQVWIPEATD